MLTGCREHNLKDVTLRVPLGVFTVVTGVSGSGKSHARERHALPRARAAPLRRAARRPGASTRIEGLEQIDKVIDVDQSPIGRTPRSNPATYTGVFDGIRELFARCPRRACAATGPGASRST